MTADQHLHSIVPIIWTVSGQFRGQKPCPMKYVFCEVSMDHTQLEKASIGMFLPNEVTDRCYTSKPRSRHVLYIIKHVFFQQRSYNLLVTTIEATEGCALPGQHAPAQFQDASAAYEGYEQSNQGNKMLQGPDGGLETAKKAWTGHWVRGRQVFELRATKPHMQPELVHHRLDTLLILDTSRLACTIADFEEIPVANTHASTLTAYSVVSVKQQCAEALTNFTCSREGQRRYAAAGVTPCIHRARFNAAAAR